MTWRFEYVGAAPALYGWPRWEWRSSTNGWVFLFGLRDHQAQAVACGWREYGRRMGWLP